MSPPINFLRWIEENRQLLKPPVGNKVIYDGADFIVMAVGGPNSRKDYHFDPAEEFFYQLDGDMLLKTIQQGRVVDIRIREGELFLLPAEMPHSPQRYAGTVGLVIERKRRPGERDGLQWYCEKCETLLYEEYFELKNIETDFPPVFARFFGDVAPRTCRHCGTVMQPPG
ncbi:MAG TPA: 3-hydroxyanthranilate 3,4-dioxygenase [Steroidobacteraceae bacterium]|nr:3-hydroxyanthranilate 3,4-dioxygenase [Steroidobacteraceae bacterium]